MKKLQGIINFRDLGNIPNIYGKHTRPHRLYRSGALGRATPDDIACIKDEFHIKYIIDLRTRIERNGDPDPQIQGVEYIHAPLVPVKTLGLTFQDYNWRELLLGKWDPDTYDVCSIYRKMVDPRVSPRWHVIFHTLLHAGNNGVLFHCSNGKDRTGLVAAIILLELNVGESEIMKDYQKTNFELAERKTKIIHQAFRQQKEPKLSDKIGPLLEARPEYINAAFDAIDETYGNFVTFLENECGIGFAEEDTLHNMYLV